MRVLSYIFVYILPSYLYFVYFFHNIYIYFLFIFIIIYNVLLYAMLCIYNIIHVSFFLRTSQGVSQYCCVYIVWKLFLQAYTSRRVHMSVSTARARSTRLQLLPFSLYVYACDLCIVVLCVRRHASLQITYTLYGFCSTWRFRTVLNSLT